MALNDDPSAPVRLKILSSADPARVGQEIRLAALPATIGRDEACTVVIKDRAASRNHARIEFTTTGLRVVDNASANGLWAGAKRVPEVPLGPGTQFRVGETVFEYVPPVAARAAAPSAPAAAPAGPAHATTVAAAPAVAPPAPRPPAPPAPPAPAPVVARPAAPAPPPPAPAPVAARPAAPASRPPPPCPPRLPPPRRWPRVRRPRRPRRPSSLPSRPVRRRHRPPPRGPPGPSPRRARRSWRAPSASRCA